MNPIPYLVGWDTPEEIIKDEVRQLLDEGRDPKWIEALLVKSRPEDSDADLWMGLQAAPILKESSLREPNDLEGIRSERAAGLKARPLAYSEDILENRMLGAWQGRCCGCALGKPAESFMVTPNPMSSKERIKVYLQAISPQEYPLNNYFPGKSPAQERTGPMWCRDSYRENIAFMETDDDIRYTVLGQKVLLDKGVNFTTLDVMKTWIRYLPYEALCTAETQAYRNYLMRYCVRAGEEKEVDWHWVSTFQNPYREWIGAQIRADSFGYAAPGNPELAAEFAWRDARMSHVKNGIYGEMFVAAMTAAAFVVDNPLAVIEAGLAEIPQNSRLSRDLRWTIDLCRKYEFKAEAYEQAVDELLAQMSHYSPIHTINNAAVVVMALLLGGLDFEKVITFAVMSGLDTDCNGATAGSIFGAMHGAGSIPDKWKAPLHDTLYSAIIDYHPISISECAKRSVKIALAVLHA